MSKVHIIFSCLVAAVAAVANQQTHDAVLVNLYHNNLDFFDSFLSPGEIDGLQYSAENIPPETIKTLRSASNSYSSMRGSLLQWCVEVNNTIDFPVENFNLLMGRDEFVLNANRRITEMKTYFNSIAMNNSTPKTDIDTSSKNENPRPDVERSQVWTSVMGNNQNNKQASNVPIKENNSQKKTMKNLVPHPPQELKRQAEVAENKPKISFEDKMNHAKSLIDSASNVIREIYKIENKTLNRKETAAKCKPVLEKLAVPPSQQPQYKPAPPTMLPSNGETLTVFSNDDTHEIVCEAILSKSTMERFVKVYRIEQTVAGFFNAFDSVEPTTPKCKTRMQSFITNSYMSWAFEVRKMANTQYLKISIFLNPNSGATVSIVN